MVAHAGEEDRQVSALDDALAVAARSRDEAVVELVEELRIPSVSTLPEHRDDCRRNADWLVARLEGLGFSAQLVDVLEGGHPVLRADWMGRPGAPVLTIYGHYDVQPPDPLDEWISPPFEPVVTNGLVVARGVADNKGNHMAAIRAIDAWMAAGGPPCNVRFLIEGEEEIGGESLPTYVRKEAHDLATDAIAVWDGGFSSDGRPALCVGLRGLLYVDVVLTGAKTDLHSGGFGGVAPNACDALAGVLAALHDETRRITVPGFYDDVVSPAPDEVAKWHRDSDLASTLADIMGTTLFGEESFSIEERLWTRPTLEVNGFVGGFTGHGAKTVIPSRASAKVSMRLVPDQDPDKILDALTSYLRALAPAGTSVEVHAHTSSPPVLLGADHVAARAAMTAWDEATGKGCVLVRTGGSIPVTTAFAEALGAPMIIGGVSSKDSGAHAPNEKLRLENYYGGIDMMIRFMQGLADGS
jgi:acetylornithine deacetylase/succinyl-diaminopimelate desuccinylase-like protein